MLLPLSVATFVFCVDLRDAGSISTEFHVARVVGFADNVLHVDKDVDSDARHQRDLQSLGLRCIGYSSWATCVAVTR